jgi:hypothetical protein
MTCHAARSVRNQHVRLPDTNFRTSGHRLATRQNHQTPPLFMMALGVSDEEPISCCVTIGYLAHVENHLSFFGLLHEPVTASCPLFCVHHNPFTPLCSSLYIHFYEAPRGSKNALVRNGQQGFTHRASKCLYIGQHTLSFHVGALQSKLPLKP